MIILPCRVDRVSLFLFSAVKGGSVSSSQPYNRYRGNRAGINHRGRPSDHFEKTNQKRPTAFAVVPSSPNGMGINLGEFSGSGYDIFRELSSIDDESNTPDTTPGVLW